MRLGRPDPSLRESEACASCCIGISRKRQNVRGLLSTSPNFTSPQLGGSFATNTFKQPRLRICRPIHAPCKKNCIRRHRGEFAAPVAQAPGSPTLPRRVLQQQRHRGASTPSPRHRQRSHRRSLPRRSTSRRTTNPQHILDHGLGPQQGPEARRGHAHQ